MTHQVSDSSITCRLSGTWPFFQTTCHRQSAPTSAPTNGRRRGPSFFFQGSRSMPLLCRFVLWRSVHLVQSLSCRRGASTSTLVFYRSNAFLFFFFRGRAEGQGVAATLKINTNIGVVAVVNLSVPTKPRSLEMQRCYKEVSISCSIRFVADNDVLLPSRMTHFLQPGFSRDDSAIATVRISA